MKRLFTILSFSLFSFAAGAQYYQQSPKYVPGGVGPTARSGRAVAVSADAATLIVGTPGGTGAQGAAVICNRSGSVWSQQQLLVGAGGSFNANQGYSVSISADGNTAVVGGPNDDVNAGAAWVFSRSGGTWFQQARLVGSGATGKASQGVSVAISGDGNTIILGGPGDNNNVGAAWIFTRSGGSWIQQGVKLVGSGSGEYQGYSVSLSYDGNTAAIGAPRFSTSSGVFIFTRTAGSWVQQGSMLDGPIFYDGSAVSLSGDGNTVLVGAARGNGDNGGAIVWVRSGSTWAQQGVFTGSLAVGSAQQGESVALSSDGNTAVLGGGAYTFSFGTVGVGAAWVFKRTAGGWNQEGEKYVGTAAFGNSQQGAGVAISSDGNTFIVGGPGDNSFRGAAWIYSKTIPSTTTPPYTSVSTLPVNTTIKLYPNPATDEISIDFDRVLNESISISIIDQMGRVVSGRTVDGSKPVYTEQVASLPAGVYILRAATATAGEQKFMFVKQ